MRIEAQTELLAARPDVWALLAEPQHLADWWPGYTSIRPDRRGLAEGARWQVVRGGSIGLLRRPESEGIVVITAVEPDFRLAWHDVQQSFTADLWLEPAADGMTRATLSVDSPGWRAVFEGLRPLPRQALARLHNLCQTAASL
ncbi:MAG TPA: SRPBCC family protein [Gaiellaceae bacterium]